MAAHDTQRVMSLRATKSGYIAVALYVGDGTRRHVNLHALVAEAFLGPRPERMTVNHKDGVKTNNAAINLEYATYKENNNHAVSLGLLNVEERSAAIRAAYASETFDRESHSQRIKDGRKRAAVDHSAAMRKAWVTRRRRAEERKP